jgi:hypothetical protein
VSEQLPPDTPMPGTVIPALSLPCLNKSLAWYAIPPEVPQIKAGAEATCVPDLQKVLPRTGPQHPEHRMTCPGCKDLRIPGHFTDPRQWTARANAPNEAQAKAEGQDER